MRTPTTQAENTRRAEMWARVLGSEKDLHKLTLGEWERFDLARRSGAIGPRGRPDAKRRSVRSRTVGADQEWLRGVIRWAITWQDDSAQYLMRENPMRGYGISKERNPKRPVATQDRYEAVRAVSDSVTMDLRRNGRRFAVRSYLSEILDIVNGTGRRVSAVTSTPVCRSPVERRAARRDPVAFGYRQRKERVVDPNQHVCAWRTRSGDGGTAGRWHGVPVSVAAERPPSRVKGPRQRVAGKSRDVS